MGWNSDCDMGRDKNKNAPNLPFPGSSKFLHVWHLHILTLVELHS